VEFKDKELYRVTYELHDAKRLNEIEITFLGLGGVAAKRCE
jgi:hypothetical protein